MYFDSHLHLQNKDYDSDRDIVINSLSSKGIDLCVCVGYDLQSSTKAVELAERYQNIFAAVGVHPSDSHLFNDSTIFQLQQLAQNKKVVAIGEIGLDYYRQHDKAKQQQVFDQQIQLANTIQKPYIIHLRDAFDDFDALYLNTPPKYGAVIHCFTGNAQQAKKYVDKGYHISLSGIITFKNAQSIRNAAQVIPLDSILIETDSPYLAPTPHRGKTNYPEYISLVAQELAILQNKTVAQIAQITKDNAKKLFRIVD